MTGNLSWKMMSNNCWVTQVNFHCSDTSHNCEPLLRYSCINFYIKYQRKINLSPMCTNNHRKNKIIKH